MDKYSGTFFVGSKTVPIRENVICMKIDKLLRVVGTQKTLSRLSICVGLLLFINTTVQGQQNFETISNGDWNDPTIWNVNGGTNVGMELPTATDSVNIEHQVVIKPGVTGVAGYLELSLPNTTSQAGFLEIDNGGLLSVTNDARIDAISSGATDSLGVFVYGGLTVGGTFTMVENVFNFGAGAFLHVEGDLNVDAFDHNTQMKPSTQIIDEVVVQGNGKINIANSLSITTPGGLISPVNYVVKGSGILAVSGNLLFNVQTAGEAKLEFFDNATMDIAGNFVHSDPGTFPFGKVKFHDNTSITFNGGGATQSVFGLKTSLAGDSVIFNNVTITNPYSEGPAVSVAYGELMINGQLDFQGGYLEALDGGDSARIVFGPASSIINYGPGAFIEGAVGVKNPTDVLLPLASGLRQGHIRIFGVTNVSPSTVIDVQYFSDANLEKASPLAVTPPLQRFSGKEYWSLKDRAGLATVAVELFWEDAGFSEIDDLPNLTVVSSSGASTIMVDRGRASTTANSITSANPIDPDEGTQTFVTYGSLNFNTNLLGTDPFFIDNVTPLTAQPGDEVSVNGFGFSASDFVRVGGVKARVSSATNTTLNFIMPKGVPYGPVSVTSGLRQTSSSEFVINAFSLAAGETIDSAAFGDTVGFGIPETSSLTDMAVADFDQNGRPDIIYTIAGSDSISVFFQALDSTFIEQKLTALSASSPNHLWVDDFNNDEWLDFAFLSDNSSIIGFYINDKAGGFYDFASTYGTPTITSLSSNILAVEPFLLKDSKYPALAVLDNVADVHILAFDEANGAYGSIGSYHFSSSSSHIAVGDFLNNGKQQIVVVDNSNSSLGLLRYDKSTGFTIASTTTLGSIDLQGITLSDRNNDGTPELLLYGHPDNSSFIEYSFNPSDSSFIPGTQISVPSGRKIGLVEVANIDGQNGLDIIAFTSDGERREQEIVVWKRSVAGDYSGPFTITQDSINTLAAVVQDITGDGHPEIIVRTDTEFGNKIFYNNTLQAAPPGQATNLELFAPTHHLVTGNFNSANAADGYLVLRRETATVPSPPTDKTVYSVGDVFGDQTVISVGPLTTFADANVMGSTEYSYDIFAFNGSGINSVFNTSAPLAGNVATPRDTLESDSLTLVHIYNTLDGSGWNNNANWLSGNLTTWHGVTVVANRVKHLELPSNKLTGILPDTIASLNGLTTLNLAGNELVGTLPEGIGNLLFLDTLLLNNNQFEAAVPDSIAQLPLLVRLDLSHNDLSKLPELWISSLLQDVRVDRNFFDYKHLESFLPSAPSIYSYSEQRIEEPGGDSLFDIGSNIEIFGPFEPGAYDSYQWFIEGDTLAGATSPMLSLSGLTTKEEGAYTLVVKNSQLLEMDSLIYGPYNIHVSTLAVDSTHLRELYNQLDGANWVNNTNWLTGPVDTWFGVTVTDNSVREVVLPSNGLSGNLPIDLVSLVNLENLDLSDNAISGGIPIQFAELNQLHTLNLAKNDIDGIPERLDTLNALDTVYLQGNKLRLSDLEFLTGAFSVLDISSMQPLTNNDELIIQPMSSALYLGSYNELEDEGTVYQWFLDGDTLAGATDWQLVIDPIGFSDEGAYQMKATNDSVPSLILETKLYQVEVSTIALDSSLLVEVYRQMDGANSWTNTTHWLTGNLETWYGVTVEGHSVSKIDLSNNGLVGNMPTEFGALQGIRELDLSDNKMDGSVSQPLFLDRLQSLDISNNKFTQVDTLSGLDSITYLDVSRNALQFQSIINNLGIATYQYNDQAHVSSDKDSLANYGMPLTFGIPPLAATGGTTKYTWLFQGDTIAGAEDMQYTINFLTKADSGTYQVLMSNSLLPGFALYSGLFETSVSSLVLDAQALTEFFNAVNGSDWTNNTNWGTSAPLETWFGVTVEDNSVTSVDLSSNNIEGELTAGLSNMPYLKSFNLRNNQLRGAIPTGWESFVSLQSLDLSANELDALRDLSGITTLTDLDVRHNLLDFNDIAPIVGISAVQYDPQSPLTSPVDTLLDLGGNYTAQLPAFGADSFRWIKDGQVINSQTSQNLNLQNVTFAFDGVYVGEATSASVPGLVLKTDTIIVSVSSLERDSVLLRQLYVATNGAGWTTQPNWATTPISSGTWDFVTVDNNRVTAVNLSGNNLSGFIPPRIRDIRALTDLNVSNNQIRRIPDLSGMSNLTNLNVSSNRISFGDLEPNAGISNFTYTNQQALIGDRDTAVIHGSPVSREINTGGEFNTYQWYLNDVAISGETSPTLSIDSVIFEDMGNYRMEVSNTLLTQETMTTGNQRLLAYTSLSGVVGSAQGAVESGEVYLFRIRNGRYDSLGSSNISTGGLYRFDSVVLSDHMVVVRPNKVEYPDALRTWYGNTFLWEEADTVFLRQQVDNINFRMLGIPDPTNGEYSLGGVVEEDVPDDGRTERIRRVSGAQVSIRRKVSSGRTLEDEYELVAITETDEEGNFEFSFLPANTYRINVQYPGVPMDESSSIDISVGETEKDSAVAVKATVLEEGIKVEIEEVQGFKKQTSFPLALYPNPAADFVQVLVGRRGLGTVHIQIQDLQGRLVLTEETRAGRDRPIRISLNRVPPGLYLLRVQDEVTGGIRSMQLRIQ